MKTICLIAAVMALAVQGLADTGPQHQVAQTRPIKLGTSGGNLDELFTCGTTTYCSSGTLGALVKGADGTLYILSNHHVLAQSVAGCGAGGLITQPGLIDHGCSLGTADAVAVLTSCATLDYSGGNNTVDGAIAAILSGQVDTSGAILDIGVPGSATLNPAVGQRVKKSGRTTGLTKGKVAAVNVTLNIDYDNCGTSPKVAKFVNQIAISAGGFSKGGDSGSLIVEDASGCPRAVGLLFAGGGNYTFANPINTVLSKFGVTMVGCTNSGGGGGGGGKPGKGGNPNAATLDGELPAAAVEAAAKAKERAEAKLFSIAGVLGAGVASSDTVPASPVIEVYVENDTQGLRRTVPAKIEGHPVRIVKTGRIVAY